MRITFVIMAYIICLFYHEHSHQTIFQEYGCTNIETDWLNYRPITTANCKENAGLDLAQANVEAYSYNIQPLALFIFTIWIMVI